MSPKKKQDSLGDAGFIANCFNAKTATYYCSVSRPALSHSRLLHSRLLHSRLSHSWTVSTSSSRTRAGKLSQSQNRARGVHVLPFENKLGATTMPVLPEGSDLQVDVLLLGK